MATSARCPAVEAWAQFGLIGAVLIITGRLAGLYLAAASMIILLAFMISGAWLLIIGASARGPDQAHR